MRSCAYCRWPIPGSRRVFCDDGCRAAAYRRRRAGIPENALPLTGRRGRIGLAENYERELLAAATAELEAARLVLDEEPDWDRLR